MSQPHQQHEQLQRRRRRCRQPAEPCECLRPVIRVFGLLTSFVICGVGVDVYMHGYQAGLFIIFSALLVLFIELKWLITIFLQLQCGDDNYHNSSSCLDCWRLSTLLGGWRPTPIYVAMGVTLIIFPHNLWLSYVAGMFLLLLALLRLCTLLRFGGGAGHFKDEGLLPQCDFEKVSSFVDSVEDDCAEVSVSQPDDEEPTMEDEVC
ncbi:uncharacterized protein [Drosophila virilis]|uniref:Transmembrane protein 72 n=1 Tax=Drosophila virilis TaxID=7244 RepID=B4LCI0_DROVI|nr:uncharacterized protein LOC6622364 [Drosophila virilis]EDW69843.2 uncharacterized protein Dvir_GJ13486 [Drosophila virilis]